MKTYTGLNYSLERQGNSRLKNSGNRHPPSTTEPPSRGSDSPARTFDPGNSRSIRHLFNSWMGGDELLLRAIACPLEHFDAIGFAARRVEDFAVAYALERGAHQGDSQHVAGRI